MADKDLIIKLAKLANNNPNDNEANSAARKVCQLLAENDFAALNGGGFSQIPMPDFGFDIHNPFYDIIRDMHKEAGRHRSTTPPRTDRTTEAYRARERQKEAEYRAEQEKQEQEAKEAYERKRKQTDENLKNKIKIPRVCIKCGNTVETTYIGDDYVCKKCRWENWL